MLQLLPIMFRSTTNFYLGAEVGSLGGSNVGMLAYNVKKKKLTRQ